MTVYLPVATSTELHAALETSKIVAVVVTRPSTHESIQFKGMLRSIRVAEASEQATVQAYHDRLVVELESIGLPRRISRRMSTWPAYAVECTVDAVFDQTPGSRAGQRLNEVGS